MNILELFSGSRSIGKVGTDRGHTVFSSDFTDFPNTDYVVDILEFDVNKVPFVPDVIWASPPCESFSVASIGRHWVKGEVFTPKTENAKKGLKILHKTMEIIEYYLTQNPNLIWYVENPRGKMRKSPHWAKIQHSLNTVTYCQYGDDRMKPTDIWNNNDSWISRKMCKNGMPCHTSAPRGSSTGTQGRSSYYDRSKIPTELCEEVIISTENKLKELKPYTVEYWFIAYWGADDMGYDYEHIDVTAKNDNEAIEIAKRLSRSYSKNFKIVRN